MTRDLVDIMGGGKGRAPARLHEDDDHNTVQSVHLHDMTVALHYDTGKAVLVSETGEEARAVWLARSQVEITPTNRNTDTTKRNGQHEAKPLIDITLPEWLAREKGLI